MATLAQRELLLGGAAVALVALVLTTALPPRPHYLALLNDAGHAPVFGALAWLLLLLLGARCPDWSPAARFLAAFAGAVLAGAAVEVLQMFLDRDASLGDWLMDAAGALGTLCAVGLWRSRQDRQRSAARGAVLLTGLVASTAIVAAPLVAGAQAYARRGAQFPVLASFERASDLHFVAPIGADIERIALPPDFTAGTDEAALKVTFVDQSYPGVQIWEPAPDWQGFRTLNIDVVNPGDDPLPLGVRVHDADHDQRYEDRFNLAVVIPPATRQQLSVPLTDIASGPRERRLDIGRVAMIAVFEGSGSAEVGRALYLRRIWLD